MDILEELAKNEKKVGMLLEIISGCDNQGIPIEMSIEEKKYRTRIYNKAEQLGIQAFDISEYSEEERRFIKKCIEKFNEISTK